jgi:hypothetical protein
VSAPRLPDLQDHVEVVDLESEVLRPLPVPYRGFCCPFPFGRAPIPGPFGGGFSWLTGFAPEV